MKAKQLFLGITLLMYGCKPTEVKSSKEEKTVPLSEQAFAHTTHSIMEISSYTKKVDRAVAFYRDGIRNRSNKEKPLILALNSRCSFLPIRLIR